VPIVTVQVGVKALPIIFRSLSPSVRTSPWPSGGIFAVLRWQPPQALNPRCIETIIRDWLYRTPMGSRFPDFLVGFTALKISVSGGGP
jgi:hypothetical protein